MKAHPFCYIVLKKELKIAGTCASIYSVPHDIGGAPEATPELQQRGFLLSPRSTDNRRFTDSQNSIDR